MEGSWQVTPSIPGWSSIGFFIEEEPSRSGSAVLIQTRGITQAGQLSLLPHGIVDFVADDGIEKGIPAGQLTKVRLLFRRTMLELYMNDELILCYSLPNKPTGRIGLLFETGQAVFEKMKAWEMNNT